MPASSTQPDVVDPTDRRVLRSRRMLMDALAALIHKKDFDDISIQEIVDKADLTRATFYLHYPDKGALLLAMASVRFKEMLKKRGIDSMERAGSTKAIALGVCEHAARILDCQDSTTIPLERAFIPVLEGIYLDFAATRKLARGVDAATFATMIAWAIYGAAYHWAKLDNRKPAEQMAAEIEVLIDPVIQAAQPPGKK
jgi:AcrR family transcriptional regulator